MPGPAGTSSPSHPIYDSSESSVACTNYGTNGHGENDRIGNDRNHEASAHGNVFAVINIDRSFPEAGSDFREQIISRLEESDVFISLYTGRDKQWPAWEIGYFERLMNEKARARKLVPIFLKNHRR
jgi:hypothetical protein